MEALERDLTLIGLNRCCLEDKASLQKVVGRLTFYARFLEHGRARLNSAYAALAVARHLQCRESKAMISAEMVRDVEVIAEAMHDEHWTPIVSSSNFEFPGSQGVSPDASLTRGRGAHAFGELACRTWSSSTQALISDGRLSINPLEMLASAATVLLLDQVGRWPSNLQIALRGDNASSFKAANMGVAIRPALHFALSIFVDVCRTTRARCWLVHIYTKANRIADLASLQECHEAEVATHEAGWSPKWADISANMREWERRLQQWAREHTRPDSTIEVDEEMDNEMKEVEPLDLELHREPH